MCGIAGIISNNVQSLASVLNVMLSRQQHRGMDETGVFKSEQCLLGHNRLSIVDISTGQQPMTTPDGRFTIVFNGEIYGYKQLKKELTYPFTTNSDTEVILAMYLEYGKNMLAKLSGMFAFAIWDEHTKELFVARDRVGEKPFYYSIPNGKKFVFASEVQTLVASKLVDLPIDPKSIGHFLSKLYIHPNHSIYKNIKSLPAGHYGLLKDGVFTVENYWNPSVDIRNISYMEAVEELEHLFKSAIKEQLVADVPVSIFLSGGLDSSTVAAYACMENPSIEALSFRFKSGFDEGLFAHDVAKLHNINIHELWEDNSHSIVDLFNRSIDCYGEPFADSSSIPTILICQEAIKYAKVVLSGDGADELFGGYVSRYRPTIFLKKMLGRSPLRLLAARYVFGVLSKITHRNLFFQYSQAAKYALNGDTIITALDEAGSLYKDDELLSSGLVRYEPIWPKNNNDVNAGMLLDIKNYLPGDILVKTDRAAMAVGLEVRAPFLAKDIMEFAMTLPANFKITKSSDKIIMRSAFEKVWPASVVNRSKQGFGSPVGAWLSDAAMIEYRNSLFSPNAAIHSHLHPDLIDRYKHSNDMKGWALLTLAAWLEKQHLSSATI